MAHTLKLTVYNNGGIIQNVTDDPSSASEIDLNSGSTITIEYIPQSPNISTVATNDIIRSGGEITNISRRNVTESARIILKPLDGTSAGSSASAMQTTIRNIGKFFRAAEEYQQNRIGNRVFVEFQPDGAASTYRSEILNGQVQATPESLDWRWRGASTAEFNLAWMRRYFWEGPIINLSSSFNDVHPVPQGGSTHTGTNSLRFTTGCVLGEIPSPIYFRAGLDDGTPSGMKYLWITNNVLSSPSSFQYWLEGEDDVIGVTTTYANSSSTGHQSSCTTNNTETDMFRWTLSTSQIEHANGNVFHVMSYWAASPPTDVKFRLEVRGASPNAILWKGEQFFFPTNASTHDMGIVRIPPLPLQIYDPDNLNFVITGEKQGGWSASLDVVQFFPTHEFRYLRVTASQVVSSTFAQIVDDGIGNLLYTQSRNGTDVTTGVAGRGKHVHVYPGLYNTIMWTWQLTGSGRDPAADGVGRVGEIRYRPRVLVI